MKPAEQWRHDLSRITVRDGIEVLSSRSGEPTLRVDGVLLHSSYRPSEEAARLIDGLEIDPERPVLVVGLGCGYHVQALLALGFSVYVLEPDSSVAKLCLELGPGQSGYFLAVGDLSTLQDDDTWKDMLRRKPQVVVHPPTDRLHPGFAARVQSWVSRARVDGQPLGVAVVGPMQGGSLPIAGHLASAFKRLGHRTLFVDNSGAWSLYDRMTGGVRSRKASQQLGSLFAHVLAEWSYARVAEFAPNICIVLAQAPVPPAWPLRLAKDNMVTAFWFVENWRHMPYWRHLAPHYDCFFHIQPGAFERSLTEAGCRHHAFVQTGCDPEVHRPVILDTDERARFACTLAFAGAGYFNRNQFFAGLTDYDLAIWGTEWTARELMPFMRGNNETFTPEQFAKIVAGAKINLNLHSSSTSAGVDPSCDAVNPRVFEIAACGGFQLCDPCQGLERHFEFETELPVYRDLGELRAKIDYFINRDDEREAVARRARDRALREHTYAHRASQMLECIMDRFASRIEIKGVRAQRTVAEVAERVGRDSPLGRYLASLPPDTVFSQESLADRIPQMGSPLTHTEGIFAYLRELRTSSEQLLAMFAGDN